MSYAECPKCGAKIVYAYGSSYYLRCERSYNCWHTHCTEAEAKCYPEYINSYEMHTVEKMIDSLENGDDYFHDF